MTQQLEGRLYEVATLLASVSAGTPGVVTTSLVRARNPKQAESFVRRHMAITASLPSQERLLDLGRSNAVVLNALEDPSEANAQPGVGAPAGVQTDPIDHVQLGAASAPFSSVLAASVRH